VRYDTHVSQANPLEQPEELPTNPRTRYRGVQRFRDSAHKHGVWCVDYGLVGVEIKRHDESARTHDACHLSQRCFRTLQIAQYALGPTEIKGIVRKCEMLRIPYLEGDRGGITRRTLAGLSNHGGIGVDPVDPSLRADALGEAQYLVPKAASHV